jgi:hypothetical protein
MYNWNHIIAFANMFYGSCTGKFNCAECEAYLAREWANHMRALYGDGNF